MNTLYAFRDEERLPPPIGDASEGTKEVQHLIDDSRSDPQRHRAALADFGFGIAPGADIEISGLSLRKAVKLPDAHIYCVSLAPSRQLMKRMGYDSCVEIDWMPFGHTLARFFMENFETKDAMFAEVTYGSRFEFWDQRHPGLHPGFLKDAAYSWQREARLVLTQPTRVAIGPRRFDCPALASYCRRIW